MSDIINLTAVIWFKKVDDADGKSFMDTDGRGEFLSIHILDFTERNGISG